MKWLIIGVVVIAVIVGVFAFSNNILLAPKNYAPALPDLTTNILINNVANVTNNGSTIYYINYTVSFKNIGSGPSTNVTGSFGSSMACNGTGGSGGGGSFGIPALNSGQSISYPWYSAVYCNGLFTAFASADIYNVLREASETNNNASVSRII